MCRQVREEDESDEKMAKFCKDRNRKFHFKVIFSLDSFGRLLPCIKKDISIPPCFNAPFI